MENVVYKYHPHPAAYWGNYVAAAIIFFAPAWLGTVMDPEAIFPGSSQWVEIGAPILGIVVVVFSEIFRLSEVFYITEDGLARSFIFLSTYRTYMDYQSIEQIETTQSLLDRLLGIGTVTIETAGEDLPDVSFRCVRNPYEVEKVIRQRIATALHDPAK